MRKLLILFYTLTFMFCCNLANATEITQEDLQRKLTAKAALVVDGQTGVVLYDHNGNMKWHPASTTKIMSSLLILENGNPNDITKISRSATNLEGLYNSRFLWSGLSLSVEQLLHMLLIESDNASCNTLAEYLDGTQANFVAHMNRKAEEMGLRSHFVTPYGMTNYNHYVTAYDLYCIAKENMKYPLFRDIVRKASYHLKTNEIDINIKNVNKLLGRDARVLGVKTGYTKAAQCNLVCYAEANGKKLYTVVLGSPRSYIDYSYPDTQLLMDYGFQELEKIVYVPERKPVVEENPKTRGKEKKKR